MNMQEIRIRRLSKIRAQKMPSGPVINSDMKYELKLDSAITMN